jgi:hypothetical protein
MVEIRKKTKGYAIIGTMTIGSESKTPLFVAIHR